MEAKESLRQGREAWEAKFLIGAYNPAVNLSSVFTKSHFAHPLTIVDFRFRAIALYLFSFDVYST